MEAVATVCALLAAGWAVGLELQAAHRRDGEARREQASKVWVLPSGATEMGPQWPGQFIYWSATVTNGSAQPIYKVRVTINTVDILGRRSSTQLASDQGGYTDFLDPGGLVEATLPETDRLRSDGDMAALRVQFIDAAGRHWERAAVGDLREL